MFFVVYQVKSGRTIAVYERESSAKGRVTKNNKELVVEILRDDNKNYWWRDRRVEWAYCNYADYGPHFYRANKKRR
jgi:hypothetical protein